MKKMMMAGMMLAALLPAMALAQTATVDHLTRDELLGKVPGLEGSAGAKGAASVKLHEYPNHYTMIALRTKNGGAEIHLNYADIFVILRGEATLVSGGSVVDGKTISPGEIIGSSLKDGTQTPVHEGDVLHIPANLPHQLLLPEKGELVYFVVKVKEQ